MLSFPKSGSCGNKLFKELFFQSIAWVAGVRFIKLRTLKGCLGDARLSAVVAGPWPHGDRFIVGFKYEITFRPTKMRFTMKEMALYSIENGKTAREEFFYSC